MMDHDTTSIPLVGLAVFGLAIGCSNHGSVEILESQLRDREDQVSQLRDQLDEEQHNLRAVREETDMLRQRLETDHSASSIELISAVARLAGIHVHPLLTGPLDTDSDGNDDQLIVLIQPRDAQHNVVKAIGELHVKLLQGEHTRRQWSVTADEASAHWRSSLPVPGILLPLPIDGGLKTEAHVIEVQMTTENDRTFTARHTLAAL